MPTYIRLHTPLQVQEGADLGQICYHSAATADRYQLHCVKPSALSENRQHTTVPNTRGAIKQGRHQGGGGEGGGKGGEDTRCNVVPAASSSPSIIKGEREDKREEGEGGGGREREPRLIVARCGLFHLASMSKNSRVLGNIAAWVRICLIRESIDLDIDHFDNNNNTNTLYGVDSGGAGGVGGAEGYWSRRQHGGVGVMTVGGYGERGEGKEREEVTSAGELCTTEDGAEQEGEREAVGDYLNITAALLPHIVDSSYYKTSYGTPLQVASVLGNTCDMRLMLRWGAKPDMVSYDTFGQCKGKTALHLVAQLGR